RGIVTHGYFVRETDPHRQLAEVLQRYAPLPLKPFSRCVRCNSELHAASKAAVESILPPLTRDHYEQFQAHATHVDGCTGKAHTGRGSSAWWKLRSRHHAIMSVNHLQIS